MINLALIPRRQPHVQIFVARGQASRHTNVQLPDPAAGERSRSVEGCVLVTWLGSTRKPVHYFPVLPRMFRLAVIATRRMAMRSLQVRDKSLSSIAVRRPIELAFLARIGIIVCVTKLHTLLCLFNDKLSCHSLCFMHQEFVYPKYV